MLKVGVIGAGHLGKIHLKILSNLKDEYEVIGFYDSDKENAKIVNRSLRIKSFKSIELLIQEVDIIDIVSPTISHFDCASLAIRSNKHVFIEKPITQTVLEAEKIMKLAREAGVKVQVGHVERFNPAFKSVKDLINQPLFIESHRLTEFNSRGTDVPVVLDLMIHDIDIIIKLVNSPVKNVQASGVAIISDTPDI